MIQLTKEQYIAQINDLEKIYLIYISHKNIYLNADIEKGGDIGLRIEIMNFLLDTSLGFWNANNECRSKYVGGISFIEYNNYKDATETIISDFLNLNNNAIFIKCKDSELNDISKLYQGYIYISSC